MLNVGFNNYLTTLDNYVKQSIKDNYQLVENEIVQKCCEDINKKLKPEFKQKINTVSNEVGKNDLVNLLSTLRNAYESAGLNKDADVLNSQIKRLDVEI